MKWKKSWEMLSEAPSTTSKADLNPKKVMCIWWDRKRAPLLWTSSGKPRYLYHSQLEQLIAALNEKHPELVNRKYILFHQDTAIPHVSLMTRQKLLQFGCEVLIHTPYSPDISPPIIHLFQSLQNYLHGRNVNFLEDCKRHLK